MFELLKNGANFFKKRQADVLSAAFVIAFSVLLSRLLGLIRYRLLASNFGDQLHLLDSYIAASILPEAIFEVLIFGAIALAFIPVFSQYLSKDKIQKAWALSSTMITFGILIFFIFTIIITVTADFLPPILAPGLVSKDPSTGPVISRLLRIMIFAQLFFVISIFVTGILQSFQRFLVPAFASVFYNFGIILSIIFLTPALGIYAPAVGMIIGALLHLIIQLPLALSLGFNFRPRFDFKNRDVLETMSLMWPRSMALGITRLYDMINVALASIAAVGSIVAFNFALVLQLMPTALFAGSLAQAAFPSLSIEFNAQRFEHFKKLLVDSLHQILFLILPAAAILAILRIPAVRLVFGAREFPWDTTVLTGRVLIAFSVGIAGQSVSLLLTRGFHAIRDSKTPVKVNILSVLIGIAGSVFFVFILKQSLIFLAASYSFANIFNALLLFFLLDRKVHFEKRAFFIPIFKMVFVSILTAIALYIPMKLLDQLVFDTTRTLGLILLTGIATLVGLLVYGLLSWVLKIREFFVFLAFGKRVISLPLKLVRPAPTSIDAQQVNP